MHNPSISYCENPVYAINQTKFNKNGGLASNSSGILRICVRFSIATRSLKCEMKCAHHERQVRFKNEIYTSHGRIPCTLVVRMWVPQSGKLVSRSARNRTVREDEFGREEIVGWLIELKYWRDEEYFLFFYCSIDDISVGLRKTSVYIISQSAHSEGDRDANIRFSPGFDKMKLCFCNFPSMEIQFLTYKCILDLKNTSR